MSLASSCCLSQLCYGDAKRAAWRPWGAALVGTARRGAAGVGWGGVGS